MLRDQAGGDPCDGLLFCNVHLRPLRVAGTRTGVSSVQNRTAEGAGHKALGLQLFQIAPDGFLRHLKLLAQFRNNDPLFLADSRANLIKTVFLCHW